jgi:8-oxo-dGTP pyrophosphatase MutT (NUDIX family)
MIGRFIAGVGALIRDSDSGNYLFLRRSDAKDFGAGAWECVTGRVDQGESFEQALRREVREELNREVTIEFIIGTTHFYRGAPAPENELLGVIYHCSLLDGEDVVMSHEHQEIVWLSADEAHAQFAAAPENGWLLRALEWGVAMREQLPAGLRATFQARGFEINVA